MDLIPAALAKAKLSSKCSELTIADVSVITPFFNPSIIPLDIPKVNPKSSALIINLIFLLLKHINLRIYKAIIFRSFAI
ncbi:hypothetical protein D3C76_693780 [compost metagenome]